MTSTRWISVSLTFCGRLARTQRDGVLDIVQRAGRVVSQRELIVVSEGVGDPRRKYAARPPRRRPPSRWLVTCDFELRGRRAELGDRNRITGMSADGSRVTASLVKLTQPKHRRMIEKTMDEAD